MNRRVALFSAVFLALAGCQTGTTRLAADGKPLPRVTWLDQSDVGDIQYRVLDSVNTLRRARGVPQLALSAELNAAAATHSRDMSVQNRPWHFGSDGSSPLERVQRSGYRGIMQGELISETYETEMETLAAWMAAPDTRGILLDGNATDLGMSFFQEQNGKIWWTLVTGGPTHAGTPVAGFGDTISVTGVSG